jgi:hypothetical protein
MFNYDFNQVDLICRVSIVLKMSPTMFSEGCVSWNHKEGEVLISFLTNKMYIPTYPNDEILYFALCGIGLMDGKEICELWED